MTFILVNHGPNVCIPYNDVVQTVLYTHNVYVCFEDPSNSCNYFTNCDQKWNLVQESTHA